MNNLFSAGLLSISVIALSGCKESVDFKSSTYSSNHTTNSTSTTTLTSGQTPTSIIVTPPGVRVIEVATVTGTTIATATSSETTTNAGTSSETNNNTNSGTDTDGTGATSTTSNLTPPATTPTDTDTGTTIDSDTNPIIETTTDSDTTPDTETTTETDTTADTEVASDSDLTPSICEAFADPIEPFVRVQLHYGLLNDAPFIAGETAGLDSLTVTADAKTGDKLLSLDSTTLLKPGQLITYVGTNGQYRVAKIGEVRDRDVTITSGRGLETAIAAGSKISNFYHDPTHPNVNGSKAVADFGVRSAYSKIEASKIHVLFGDSWFDADQTTGDAEIEKQLNVRLPGSTIFNEGLGGETLCDLINRFDTDVTPKNPDYVWVNSSINDYFAGVFVPDYKIRLQYLISKIQSIGAEAIVFDSAPPTQNNSVDSETRRSLANGYSGVVRDLFLESQE